MPRISLGIVLGIGIGVIGNSGRRALALVFAGGVFIVATDKDVAGHAVALVFEG